MTKKLLHDHHPKRERSEWRRRVRGTPGKIKLRKKEVFERK